MDDNVGIPSEDPPTILFIGQHESQRTTPITSQVLGQAQSLGYDLLTAPITTEHFQSRVLSKLQDHVEQLKVAGSANAVPWPTISPLMPEDTDFQPEESNSALIAVVSPWIDLGSSDPLIAHISRQVFNLEVAYASFCGVSNVMVHGPITGSNVTLYSRAVLEGLALGPYVQIHILMPMTGELELEGAESAHLSELARPDFIPGMDEDEDTEPELYSSWESWNTIRTMCNYSSKLVISLELPRQLPSLGLQSRWHSEPVRTLMLPRTSFLRNAKGFPVLSKGHQLLLTRFLSLKFSPWLLLADVDAIEMPEHSAAKSPEPTPAEAATKAGEKPKDPIAHLRYMRHLQQTQPSRPPIQKFGQGYQDYIQSPLQPLTDNLESITYEVFEKDPVKYEWYEKAAAAALKDLQAKLGGSREIIVAVVGAGRGPLVTRVLRASKSTGIKVTCCAVEKNPNAHVLIQRRNATDPLWNKQVIVVKTDMRSWPGPTINNEVKKVDILVSELLGSFGDNELSPECLDGVQHVLHPEHGINIPQNYSAWMAPIATPRLHADLLSRGGGSEKWELPAVVMLHQYDDLCVLPGEDRIAEVKEAWTFTHPAPPSILAQSALRAGGTTDAGGWTGGDGKNEHNARSCKVTFHATERGVCHGLGGYFESVLYAPEDGSKPIELSINPVTIDEKSRDMISWFPIFFPLKTPMYVPDNAEIEVSMWRQTDDRKVWYEWFVEVFKIETAVVERIVDEEGKKQGFERKKRTRVAVSELHSSRANGCLM
ncbi:unnamed protein product [Zymoseptoria tritici ST99CH_1A5]|uniref:Protein arginine N-methyltransferase n=2 Tax=Zymoseptoria tritici TaxID=1047171 RepID=A0A1X7S2W0_ZYMT9|nr:unnamed protein product [Zymoseptoria tritici ST99CH_3D7]SMY27662.1 unnamed protein product [Zymoseptoria tritici ST99CH_1A5]